MKTLTPTQTLHKTPKLLLSLLPLLILVTGLLIGLFLAYQLHPTYQFNLGEAEIDPALNGFYGPEHNADFAYRWSYPEWEISLPLPGRQPFQFEIEALSLGGGETRILGGDGKELGHFSPTGSLQTYRVTIPASAVPGNELRLKISSPTFSVAGDKRELGLLVTKLNLKAEAGGLVLPPVLAGLGLLGLIVPLYLIPVGMVGLGNWRLRTHWFLVGASLILGWAVCWLAATDRSSFAHVLFPAGVYLGVSAGLQYFFLLVPQGLEILLNRFKPLQIIPKAQAERGGNQSQAWKKWFKIANFSQKELSRQVLLWGSGAVLVYLLWRLPNLTALPVFLDEALHIQAAREAQKGHLWEVALTGKALQSWLLAVFYNFTGADSWLAVGRLLSVFSGLATLAGCYLIGTRLYSRRVGLVAAWLWAILPYNVWHDRMALVDTLMTAFTVLVFLFSLRLFDVRQPSAIFGYGLLVGLALTCSELTKLSGAAAALTPFAVLVFVYPPRQWLRLAQRLATPALVFFLTTVPVIRLYDGIWGGENQDERFAGFQPAAFTANLQQIGSWLYSYLTVPLLLALVILPLWVLWRDWWRGIMLLLLALLPLLVLIILSRIIYSRYLLFMLVPLVLLIAAMLVDLELRLPRRRLGPGLALILSLPLLWLNWQMVSDPATAPLSSGDRVQYVEAWPSGYGLNEVANYLEGQAKTQNRRVTVLVRNAPLTASDGLIVTLGQANTIVAVNGVYPPQAGLADRLRRAATREFAFIVVTKNTTTGLPDDSSLLEAIRAVAPELKLELVFSAPKPGGYTSLEVYRISGS